MFDWMAWTLPVAVFFTCIVLMLVKNTATGSVQAIQSNMVFLLHTLPIAKPLAM